MTFERLGASALALVFTVACWGEQPQIGVAEPFRVRAPDKSPAAQFFLGKLPGSPPPETPIGPPKPKIDAGADSGIVGPPEVIGFRTAQIAYQGQGSIPANGDTTENAYSIGFALDEIGTGYWVVPVGDVDVETHLRTWSMLFDVDTSVPAGYRKLLAVALDEQGTAGQQRAAKICIGSRVPDNLNACEATSAPPKAVISLTWDTNVDLDLQVLTPDARLIEPKSPIATPPLDGGALPKVVDVIDRDSNANCAIDGIRAEHLVWNNEVPHGQYNVFANLFSACGQPSVRFRVEIYVSTTNEEDGGRHLTRFYPRPEDAQGGELLDISANAGTVRGLFVTSFNF